MDLKPPSPTRNVTIRFYAKKTPRTSTCAGRVFVFH
jgi:hypothetical protein